MKIQQLMAEWTPQGDSQKSITDFQLWGRRYDLRLMGYVQPTMQRNFCVMVKRDASNVAKILRGLRILVPLLKTFPDQFGLADHVYVGIFEHTLSKDGSYHMMISRDLKSASIVKSFYQRETVEISGLLGDIMAYVAKAHWYGD